MSNYSKLYWLTRLDYLQGIFLAVSIIAGLAILFYCMFSYLENNEVPKRKILLPSLIGIFISVLITCLIPTKNEAIIIMAGGKALDYVQKDSSLSKVPYQTTEIISEYLDKTLKELKDKK